MMDAILLTRHWNYARIKYAWSNNKIHGIKVKINRFCVRKQRRNARVPRFIGFRASFWFLSHIALQFFFLSRCSRKKRRCSFLIKHVRVLFARRARAQYSFAIRFIHRYGLGGCAISIPQRRFPFAMWRICLFAFSVFISCERMKKIRALGTLLSRVEDSEHHKIL